MYRPTVVLARGLGKVVHCYLHLGGSFHLHPSIARLDRLYLVHCYRSAKIETVVSRNMEIKVGQHTFFRIYSCLLDHCDRPRCPKLGITR